MPLSQKYRLHALAQLDQMIGSEYVDGLLAEADAVVDGGAPEACSLVCALDTWGICFGEERIVAAAARLLGIAEQVYRVDRRNVAMTWQRVRDHLHMIVEVGPEGLLGICTILSLAWGNENWFEAGYAAVQVREYLRPIVDDLKETHRGEEEGERP